MTETGSPGAGGVPALATLPLRHRAVQSDTVIRPYAEVDAPAVATLWRESAVEWPGGGPFGGRHATAEGVRHEQRARHPLETFIAWRDDPVSGSAIAVGYCSLLAQPDDATATYVGLLTAHPAWHGQGVGRDLLMAAISRTIEVGRDRVDLHTWSGNLKAVPLYKKVGFFWVPDTSVRMANFLPMLMRVGSVRSFFERTGADWYADSVRTLDLSPDRDTCGTTEVYRYAWQRDGARLEATIDRHANALVALATPNLEVGIAIDDTRVPTGTERTATFRIAVPDGRPPVTATFVANGSGAVRTTRQAHRTVTGGTTAEVAWCVEGVLSGPPPTPRPGMASPDLVKVLAVVDDEPIAFATAARVVPRVTLTIDDIAPLLPRQARSGWITVENETDESVTTFVRATATGPFSVSLGQSSAITLAPRARSSLPIQLLATGVGNGTLHVTGIHGDIPDNIRLPVHAGDAGEIFVDQTEAHVRVTTDDLVITAPLANSGWQPTFTVADRHTGHALLRHSCGLGPPFSPSPISASTWTPVVTHHASAVTVVLRALPTDLPGVTFERHLRIATSGVIDVRYHLVNGSDAPLTFDVGTGTSAELDGSRHTRIACVVDGAVVDDESDAFPDWEEPSGGASRLSEGWIAEYGDGMVVGAIWTDAADVHGDGRLAELVLPLGTVPPGASAETSAVRLYAGPGDWRAVRTRWRAFTNVKDHAETAGAHRGVDTATIAHPFTVDSKHETDLTLSRANDRPYEGSAQVVAGDVPSDAFVIAAARALSPATGRVTIAIPSRPGAINAIARFTSAEATTDVPLPLVRVGQRDTTVSTSVDATGPRESVCLDTGAMRIRLLPTQRARIVAIETPGADGTWVDHLLSSEPEPRPWVWFNPWFGGISAHLRETGWHTGHTPLDRAMWTWHTTTARRAGIDWHGVTSIATIVGPTGAVRSPDAVERARLAGISVEVAYLVAGGGTTIAIEATVRNGSSSRLRGTISIPTYWKPGGSTEGTTVHYDRRGPRSRHRTHGAHWSATEGWVAIVDATGTAVPVVVTADSRTTLMGGDMGLNGVHPFASMPIDLDPRTSRCLRLWVSVAANLEEARAWRNVVGTPLAAEDQAQRA
jgi:GNAT superfamily N-acetyltransferase